MLPEISNSSNTLLQPVDLTSENSINCAFSAAVNKFGRIDVVVNNAGYGVLGEFESIPTEVHRELFEVLRSIFYIYLLF
jgi:NAD(P)-dependent dehydrogenase (short-subunit alcohol dehydrogenase family)